MEKSGASELTRSRRFSPSLTGRFIEDAQRQRVIVKDHNYFRDRSWNNSYLASGKTYAFFHDKENRLRQQQAEFRERIRWEEHDARQTFHETRAVLNRQSALDSIERVTKHRLELQQDAGQPVHDRHHPGILRLTDSGANRRRSHGPGSPFGEAKKSNLGSLENLFDAKASVQMLNLMNHKPSLIWNKITRLNSKNLDLCLTPAVIEADRKAFEQIQRRKRAEEEEARLLGRRKQWVHDHIRFKGKVKPLDKYPVKVEQKETRYRRFLGRDDGDANGLLMNDVLRVKGAVANRAMAKLLRSNSLLRMLKSEDCHVLQQNPPATPVGEGPEEAPEGPAPDDLFCVDDKEVDFRTFEENLKKARQFKEAKYPRINLGKINRAG